MDRLLVQIPQNTSFPSMNGDLIYTNKNVALSLHRAPRQCVSWSFPVHAQHHYSRISAAHKEVVTWLKGKKGSSKQMPSARELTLSHSTLKQWLRCQQQSSASKGETQSNWPLGNSLQSVSSNDTVGRGVGIIKVYYITRKQEKSKISLGKKSLWFLLMLDFLAHCFTDPLSETRAFHQGTYISHKR